jgi:DNA ligase-1
MLYEKLVELYESLEKTPSRLKKVEEISGFLKSTGTDDLPMVTLLARGTIFPEYSEEQIGIADRTIIKVLASSTGFPEAEVMKLHKQVGDFGLVSEELMKKKKQFTLGKKSLSVRHVFDNLQKLASMEGSGSQESKIGLVKELIIHTSPKESKYIVRTILDQMRIGVASGVMRDSIARAFLPCETDEEFRKSVDAVEWAWFMRSDYSEISVVARERGLPGLKTIKPRIGSPIQPLLGEKSPSLEEALSSFDSCAIEFKYDGMRTQIHKRGDKILLFTRRLENVTDAFPDIVRLVKECVRAEECIIEGEALGIGRNGMPLPFQKLSQRIHRKYDIHEMANNVPAQVNLFDVLMFEGKPMFDIPFRERRKILESMIKVRPGRFQLAEQLVTKDIKAAEKFYDRSLKAGQEGVMVKNMDSIYQPGRRVAGGMLKVKPIMETLDLVITGAQWGTGKRATWFGSFILSCRDRDRFLECGMMGTGIKEKKGDDETDVTFDELTKLLKPYVKSEKENVAMIKPKIVVEVAYEEIQKSPNYSSGYALRFPRLVRMRTEEKGPEDCDTLERVGYLYKMQKNKANSG